jgi:hypothetical protein
VVVGFLRIDGSRVRVGASSVVFSPDDCSLKVIFRSDKPWSYGEFEVEFVSF